jgi:hypothetical protein
MLREPVSTAVACAVNHRRSRSIPNLREESGTMIETLRKLQQQTVEVQDNNYVQPLQALWFQADHYRGAVEFSNDLTVQGDALLAGLSAHVTSRPQQTLDTSEWRV